MATYQTFRNGLPARVSRQFEEEYEQPIKYQVSSGQVDTRKGWEIITTEEFVWLRMFRTPATPRRSILLYCVSIPLSVQVKCKNNLKGQYGEEQ